MGELPRAVLRSGIAARLAGRARTVADALIGLVVGIGVGVLVVSLFGAACLFAMVSCDLPSGTDYAEPSKGAIAVGTVDACNRNRYEPCGWVYYFPGADLELCVIWDDRALVLGHPPKLIKAAQSLYGDCELATHERFSGVPLCKYQCPSAKGCNATGGCFCLDTP